MDYSVQTGGVQFAPITSAYSDALAGVKPLAFRGGAQFAPLAGYAINSPKPELVSEGISRGLGALGDTIGALYVAKASGDTSDAKSKQTEKLANIRAGNLQKSQQDRLQESIRHNKEIEQIDRDRIRSAIPPNYGDDTTAESSSSETQNTTDGGSLDEVDYGIIPDASTTQEFDPINVTSPISSLQTETPITAAPSPRGSDALAALGAVPWNNIKADYSASNQGSIPLDVPSNQPDFLRDPQKALSSLKNLGGFSDEALKNTDKALAGAQKAYAQQYGVSPKTSPEASQTAVSGQRWGVPRSAWKTYADAQSYMEEQAGNPRWYAEGTPKPDKFGNFIIPWKQQNPEIVKQHDEMNKQREHLMKLRDTRVNLGVDQFLAQDPRRFEQEDNVKNYQQQRGLLQSLVRLYPTYEQAIKDPVHSAIPDQGMAQLMAQAELGGTPAITPVEEYLHSQGIPDTIEIFMDKLKGGNARLSNKQKNEMFELMLNEAKGQASLANQTVDSYHQTYSKLVDDPEKFIHHFVLPKTKDEALQEANSMAFEVKSLKEQIDKATQNGDKATAAKLQQKWNKKSKDVYDLINKIQTSPSNLVNYHEILTQPQGFLSRVPVDSIHPEGLKMLQDQQEAMLPVEQTAPNINLPALGQ
jgi:hypothetical protein